MRVSPFGYLRINGYVLLPAAFRSLSRPSSAPDAKAFALCSFHLTCLHHFVMLGMHSVAHPLVCFESLNHLILWFSIFGRLELSFDYSNLSFLYSVFKVLRSRSLLY